MLSLLGHGRFGLLNLHVQYSVTRGRDDLNLLMQCHTRPHAYLTPPHTHTGSTTHLRLGQILFARENEIVVGAHVRDLLPRSGLLQIEADTDGGDTERVLVHVQIVTFVDLLNLVVVARPGDGASQIHLGDQLDLVLLVDLGKVRWDPALHLRKTLSIGEWGEQHRASRPASRRLTYRHVGHESLGRDASDSDARVSRLRAAPVPAA